MIRAKFLKGSQFIFLLEQTMLNRKSQSCAFPHLDSRFALSGKKSPANASAFGKSNSRLCAAAMSQPRGAEGKRGRGALLRVPAAPHGEKGLAFLPFPPAEGIPGAGWERNPHPCWNGEGEEAHSFTALWAGLLLALTHWATCFSSVCWPEGFIFSWSLCQLDVPLKTTPGMISSAPGLCVSLPQPHYPLCPCNALPVCPAQPGNTRYISQG